MKVRLEFDTMKPAHSFKVYHDDIEQTGIRNMLLIADAWSIPSYSTNLHEDIVEIIRRGLKDGSN